MSAFPTYLPGNPYQNTNGGPHLDGTVTPLSTSSTLLGTLRILEYRYSRFVLNPRTGLFVAIRSAGLEMSASSPIDNLHPQGLERFGMDLDIERQVWAGSGYEEAEANYVWEEYNRHQEQICSYIIDRRSESPIFRAIRNPILTNIHRCYTRFMFFRLLA